MKSALSNVKELIGKNEAALAILFLKEIIHDKNDIILLESRLNLLEKKHITGLMSFDEYKVELTKINNALLTICDENQNAQATKKQETALGKELNYLDLKSNMLQNKELLYRLHEYKMERDAEQTILSDFEFPGQINFDFAILSVHRRVSQVSDKVTFVKLFEINCSFDFAFVGNSIDVSQSILKKSSVSGFGLRAQDGILEILESRDDYRLNLKVECFDRKMILVMGRRNLTPKSILIEMKTFNSMNPSIELLTYDGLGEKIAVDWFE